MIFLRSHAQCLSYLGKCRAAYAGWPAAKYAAEESKKYAKYAEYQPLVIKVDVADQIKIAYSQYVSMINHIVKEFGRIELEYAALNSTDLHK